MEGGLAQREERGERGERGRRWQSTRNTATQYNERLDGQGNADAIKM